MNIIIKFVGWAKVLPCPKKKKKILHLNLLKAENYDFYFKQNIEI